MILLAGLQGAGKTTMAGKLGAYCQKHFGKSPLLVACDVYRPAAIKQLQVVGEKLNLPVFEKGTQDPVSTAQEAVEYAKRNMRDMVIVDTAGRLHIDSDMMAEIEKVRDVVNPAEWSYGLGTYLVTAKRRRCAVCKEVTVKAHKVLRTPI